MTIRISGFNTGLDIDQIVKDLMATRRQPLNRLLQQKTILEWKREQYRELSTKIVDFRNNKILNYSMSSSIAAKKAVVTGDQSAVTVRATPSATAGEQLTIQVNRLATAGTAVSQKKYDVNMTFKELKDDDNSDFNYVAVDGKIKFTINGKEIELDEETDTIATMIQKINNSGAGVTAYFDSKAGLFSIRTKKTGDEAKILFAEEDRYDENNNLVKFLDNFNLNIQNGQDAEVVINGITTTRDSNTFTENGMEITLNAVSSSESTIRIATDTDKIVEMVKSFINDYNSILDTVNKKLNEERFRNYAPLTSEQKEEMKEKEIELWESKAKSGLLRNDNILSTMINEFRLAILTDVRVNGEKVNLAQYGIGTGEYGQRGKLVIVDEDKLRAKIEEDPEKFMKLFIQSSSIADETEAQKPTAADSGLFKRLSNTMSRALDQLAEKAGVSRYSTDTSVGFSDDSLMGRELQSLSRRIQDLNSRMITIENNYYKQFTAMEVAISRFNTQSAALSSFWQ